jgi:hypothetical protein
MLLQVMKFVEEVSSSGDLPLGLGKEICLSRRLQVVARIVKWLCAAIFCFARNTDRTGRDGLEVAKRYAKYRGYPPKLKRTRRCLMAEHKNVKPCSSQTLHVAFANLCKFLSALILIYTEVRLKGIVIRH